MRRDVGGAGAAQRNPAYQTGFGYYNIGSAATGSVFLTAIIAVITVLYFHTMSHRVHYQ